MNVFKSYWNIPKPIFTSADLGFFIIIPKPSITSFIDLNSRSAITGSRTSIISSSFYKNEKNQHFLYITYIINTFNTILLNYYVFLFPDNVLFIKNFVSMPQ